MREDIRNFNQEELLKKFKGLQFESYRARQVLEWLYKRDVDDFAMMSNLPRELKEKLGLYFCIEKLAVEEIKTSRDMTQKFLFRLKDNTLIESVSIPLKARLTACLSTQVGCKFSCTFCASGSMGFKRNLEACEIIAQFLAIKKNVPLHKVNNVVFMGIGEPLDNYENCLRAIRILNDPGCANLGIRKMTISTAGFAPAIERLAKEGLQIELSVSLHAATDEKRSELLPINNRFPLKPLFKAVETYMALTKRKVTFEYILLGGFNSSVEDAQSLIRLVRGLNVRINLIPYNPGPARGRYFSPTKLEVLFFKNYLAQKGIDVFLRMPRGVDIAAACGQLKYHVLRKEKQNREA
jgi:23S rRNA (adenine2503-C2)-methyltransferase